MRDCSARLAIGLLVLNTAIAAGGAEELEEVRRQFGAPVMWVARPCERPVIDGRLDEDAWRAAQAVTLRYLNGQWETPTQKTEARVLADEKAIYLAVRCHQADPRRMVAAGTKRDGPLRNGDTIEVFLDPGHRLPGAIRTTGGRPPGLAGGTSARLDDRGCRGSATSACVGGSPTRQRPRGRPSPARG